MGFFNSLLNIELLNLELLSIQAYRLRSEGLMVAPERCMLVFSHLG